jgi:hypothetical protein
VRGTEIVAEEQVVNAVHKASVLPSKFGLNKEVGRRSKVRTYTWREGSVTLR